MAKCTRRQRLMGTEADRVRLEANVCGNWKRNYEIRILIGSKDSCLRTLVARIRGDQKL